MLLWPARIVTPAATLEPAHLRAELGSYADAVDKGGATIATLYTPSIMLDAEGEATGSPIVVQRWHVEGEGPDGPERWLVEVVKSCGCGSTRVTSTNPLELAW